MIRSPWASGVEHVTAAAAGSVWAGRGVPGGGLPRRGATVHTATDDDDGTGATLLPGELGGY